MRDAIARILAYILTFVLPGRGRHAADPAPSPAPVSPWSRPWSSPTKEEAQALFRKQAEMTMQLGVIRERRRAAALATLGVDYPYSYPGAPFPASAFQAAGVSA
ncbi:hypothetical protein OG413_29140 [Streptomyces sp. NBC_01433]|uniref:hypothetical protein n=1 Tax=Streptomyces sp. NBC_01433 TaxID=2903864 RepID=UPI002257F65F|nr:hypothetical protein [Streptomyces sp. NBC_01433]MCX4679311.1 hypothetical protein [Streptomyces sp. NBC_01433]